MVKHIETITAKANSTLGMVCRNIKKAPTSVKEQIFKTLIRPQLEYASCMWSPWLKQDILELEKVQRRAAHFVYNNYWPTASVTEMISTLNWETLEKRREKARLCMLYKTINGLIKIPMDYYKSSTFTSTRSFHGQILQLPSCRTDIYTEIFIFPGEATNSRSLQSFKQLLIINLLM